MKTNFPLVLVMLLIGTSLATPLPGSAFQEDLADSPSTLFEKLQTQPIPLLGLDQVLAEGLEKKRQILERRQNELQLRALISQDKQFLAATKEELQMYTALGMQYQIISSPLIRKQLVLADGEGVMIQSVEVDSLGAKAGFQEGDLVLRVADVVVDTSYDFVVAVQKNQGKEVSVLLKETGMHWSLDPQSLPTQ